LFSAVKVVGCGKTCWSAEWRLVHGLHSV